MTEPSISQVLANIDHLDVHGVSGVLTNYATQQRALSPDTDIKVITGIINQWILLTQQYNTVTSFTHPQMIEFCEYKPDTKKITRVCNAQKIEIVKNGYRQLEEYRVRLIEFFNKRDANKACNTYEKTKYLEPLKQLVLRTSPLLPTTD